MKVMTYNILNGGQDDLDYGRLESVLEVVRAEAPDVLVVQELNHAELFGHRVLHRLENETGLRGFLAAAKTGYHVGVFVPKRCEVRKTEADSDHFHHAAIEVVVETSDGPLTIVGTHLCPFGGEVRVLEAQYLTRFASSSGRKVLLMGDLNSLSPSTEHAELVKQLPAVQRARHVVPGTEYEVDTRAIATLAGAGFVDLWQRFHDGEQAYTIPTASHARKVFPGARIDYILGSEPVAELATSCTIVSGEAADVASDHYPVVAELDLELR
jgi:exodeoxyribonuclease III